MFDITARRQAEKELFRIKERQKAILESARDYAILTLDLNSRVQDWNAGAEAVFGYAEREIVGESGDLFFVPEDRAAGVPERERVTALQQGWAENERWHVRKDGSRFYGSGITSPLLNEGGKVIGLVKVMRDLTSQKQAEDALKEADRRKNEFLAMLAHELRNPMATL
ncbi:hybrid sensor histidine kinase/response regulator, partial [Siphonobacter sp. BAB-5385]